MVEKRFFFFLKTSRCTLHWFEKVFWQQIRAYKIEGRERTDPCGNRRVGSISCLVQKMQILALDRSPKNARDEGGHSRFVLLDTLRDKGGGRGASGVDGARLVRFSRCALRGARLLPDVW